MVAGCRLPFAVVTISSVELAFGLVHEKKVIIVTEITVTSVTKI